MIRKIKNFVHLILAFLANVFYGFPSKKLKIIGVTGTDGKTTTVSVVYHVLKKAKKKVSLVTTVSAVIGGDNYDTGFHVTTPNPFFFQKIIKKSVDAGDEYFLTEVTSHGLDQNRVFGVSFDFGLITNVSNEHLDYHKTYDNYVKTKAKLLLKSKNAFLNKHDRSYKFLKKILKSNGKKYKTYGLEKDCDFYFSPRQIFFLNLPQFQQYNFAAAYAICKKIGLSDSEIIDSLKTFKPPKGRMDVVYDKDFQVMIDFAHTPNAIEKWLSSLSNKLRQEGRIIHVFGSAAHRDILKRPFMGESSSKYANLVILTEEDYRTENPLEICNDIAKGLKKHKFKKVEVKDFGTDLKQYCYILDRQEAIKKALSVAKKNDIVTITGKGHEQSLCRGKIEYPWDEKQAVMKVIKTLKL